MSWLGLLLVGIAVTDLAFSVRPVRPLRHGPAVAGAAAAVLVALGAGLTSGRDLLALAGIVVVVLGWAYTVPRGFRTGQAWWPLLVLAGGVALAVLVSGAAPPADGLLGAWLDGVGLPLLAGLSPDRALLLLGVVLLQMSTGNVVVRLVLAATHTVNPAREGTPSDPATRLKGGRLLGPMERLLILALALAGEATAATVVVAAKGLLRFPELSARREQERIHRLTEYFLVGSFASWLVALAGVLLLA
ncbi:hypothetical protein [Nocardioides sp. GXQ0305]|uniref:hypothetical protein n=1 Tax=Nocardioides sp. GXQ0305 TaxID=3423912 RepID=UPI003D7E104C